MWNPQPVGAPDDAPPPLSHGPGPTESRFVVCPGILKNSHGRTAMRLATLGRQAERPRRTDRPTTESPGAAATEKQGLHQIPRASAKWRKPSRFGRTVDGKTGSGSPRRSNGLT